MDREQEQMQFLGLFGIIKESFKIIISWRKIFSQITLTLILPLTFVFLGHFEMQDLLFHGVNLSDKHSSEWIKFNLFKSAYVTLLLNLSLLSTAAVIYTIASVYTGRDLTYKKVMSVVPKVWKRLMVTFACSFTAFIVYGFLVTPVIGTIIVNLLSLPYDIFVAIMLFLLVIVYATGYVYITVIWHLASVVAVLESSNGLKAMTKSMYLIKGNHAVSISIFFIVNMSFIVIYALFDSHVVEGRSLGAWHRIEFGILCSLLLLTLFLFGLVIQTIIYLVCKSYHHENIDKGDLSNHLESYLGEYEPLNAKDIQLEQHQV